MAAEEAQARDLAVRFAMCSDPGTERKDNEDACGSHIESPTHVVLAVADGVSGENGGEVASRMAVDITLRAYRESPPTWGAAKRLFRAAQEANIEIHDRALVVTELCRMSTTLTAVAIDGSMAYAVHVGDSRLYLIREQTSVQKTKDHTVAQRRRRMGVVSAEGVKDHPGRSILTRSLGRELIAAIDRITFPVTGGDLLLTCSDGLYNVLSDEELTAEAVRSDPETASRALIELACSRGAPDNVTVAIAQVNGIAGPVPTPRWQGLMSRLLGSRS